VTLVNDWPKGRKAAARAPEQQDWSDLVYSKRRAQRLLPIDTTRDDDGIRRFLFRRTVRDYTQLSAARQVRTESLAEQSMAQVVRAYRPAEWLRERRLTPEPQVEREIESQTGSEKGRIRATQRPVPEKPPRRQLFLDR